MIQAVIFDWGRTLFDSERDALFPETVDMLRYLSEKYRLAIVSLATRGNLDERYNMVREMCIEEYFTSILFAQTDKDGLYVLTLARLGLKAGEAGRTLLKVNPQFTSQACSQSGQVRKKDLSERWHSCDCGAELDRDVNAAINILARGKKLLGGKYPTSETA